MRSSDVRPAIVQVGEEPEPDPEDTSGDPFEKPKDRHLGKLVQVRLLPKVYDEFCRRASLERRDKSNFLAWWIEESFRRLPMNVRDDPNYTPLPARPPRKRRVVVVK